MPRGRPFEPGRSGNSAGRPRGVRPKHLQLMDEVFAEGGEEVARMAVQMAKAGDVGAMRLCAERAGPPPKDRPIHFYLPPIETPADLTKATGALLHGVASGEITPSQAAELAKIIDIHMRAIEAANAEARVAAAEAQLAALNEAGDGGEA